MPLSLTLSIAATLGIWALMRRKRMSIGVMISLVPLSMIAVLLGATNVIFAIENGYDGDSYWTLKTGGRIGVALISAIGLTVFFVRWV